MADNQTTPATEEVKEVVVKAPKAVAKTSVKKNTKK